VAETSYRQVSNSAPSGLNQQSTGSSISPDVAAHRKGSQTNALVQEQDRVDAIPPEAEPLTAKCNASVAESDDPTHTQTPDCAADARGCAPVRPAQSLARKVKIVLRLEPVETQLRALVAIGSDDCDPELRMLDAGDLVSVLELIPALLSAAETRWASQARYPMAARPRSQRIQPSVAPQTAPTPSAPTPTAPTPTVPSATQSQLQLFA
jgi:hypothetical protein